MKKSKFTEAQITFALRQAGQGTRVVGICRKMGAVKLLLQSKKDEFIFQTYCELRVSKAQIRLHLLLVHC